MKNSAIILLLAAMALTGCGASSSSAESGQASSRQDKKAAELDVFASMVERGSFLFTARTTSPTGGRTIQLTSEYTMKAKEGMYEANLPYFGRAYSASYGGDGGIEFRGEPENLQVSRNDRKNTLSLSFRIKSGNDQYNVSLEIGASGYGTLTINSQNRANISYYGLVSELRP